MKSFKPKIFSKYFSCFFYSFKKNIKEPFNIITVGFLLIVCLLIFSQFWKIMSVNGQIEDPTKIMWYLAFNEWIILSIPAIHLDIENELRKKILSSRLIMPISYLKMKFFENFAKMLIYLFFLFIFSFLFVGFYYQSLGFDSFMIWLFFILLSILSAIIALIYYMIIGVLSFWVQDIKPIYWVIEKMLFVTGGLIFPFFMYPKWFLYLSYATPFSAILGIRSSLIFNPSMKNILFSFLSLILWGVLGIFLLIFLFNKAINHLLKGRV